MVKRWPRVSGRQGAEQEDPPKSQVPDDVCLSWAGPAPNGHHSAFPTAAWVCDQLTHRHGETRAILGATLEGQREGAA